MMIKIIAAFTVGILISGLLFTLQTLNYRTQAELANLKLEVRITELEQQLEDAVSGRPSFTAVPTQADREALRFPAQTEVQSSSDTLSSENQLQLTGSTQVTPEFINLLAAAATENDLLTQQMFNDVPSAMEAVQKQALSGNFAGFFEILSKAQTEVDKSRSNVETANLAVVNLAAYTNNTDAISDSIKSAVNGLEVETLRYSELLNTFIDLLNQTLTGNLPSQDLLDEIDAVSLQVNEQAKAVTDQYLTLVNSIAS